MNRQFTLLIDHDRRGRGHIGPQIMPLEFMMRSLHARPVSRRLDREIDGRALNYINDSTRKDIRRKETKCSTN